MSNNKKYNTDDDLILDEDNDILIESNEYNIDFIDEEEKKDSNIYYKKRKFSFSEIIKRIKE